MCDVEEEIFFEQDDRGIAEEGMTKNCLRRVSDLM